ncbi:MAG: uncharacterized protein QOJ13_689 [Gaiellales bacterium]|nr:uncharacterized protein [Gaiellales bacterium]
MSNLGELVPYPTDGIELVKNVMIPTRDGTRLAADLYLPEGAGAVPLVMEYIPYRKDDVAPGTRFYEDLVRGGYGVARVDCRGSGASEGSTSDEYLLVEQLEGYDAVEWLSAQEFCDGHVCMMGISYGGFTSLQVASHAPPHLTAIVPVDFTDDRYRDDCHYVGGLMRMYFDPGVYGNFMVAFNAMPPDPATFPGDWAKTWEEHLGSNEPYMLEWVRHQVDGDYWRNGSVGHIADRIKCPVFMIGGWRDGYMNAPIRLWDKLQVPKRMLIGPWNHARPDEGVPGPRIDYLPEVIAWLDQWCRDATPVDPDAPVTVYMQRYDRPDVDRLDTPGEWRSEIEWPAPGAGEHTLYLSPGGRLGEEQPKDEEADELEYIATTGVAAGLFSAAVPYGLPADQRVDEARSLVYTSPPLEDDVHVLGRASVVLHVTTTASVLGFFASVSEVGPDGSSHLVAKGALNGTRRESFTDPKPLPAGEMVELVIPVDGTGWTFTAGNRIRVAIANADFPNVWPTPEPATSLIHRGGSNASRLVLPTVPVRGSATAPDFVPSRVAVVRNADKNPRPRWEVIDDVFTGERKVALEFKFAGRHDCLSESTVDPRDPSRAMSRGRFVMRRDDPGHLSEATSEAVITGTRTHFHVTIDLELRVNGAVHANRRWTESIPRRLL